jgi:hypothetical protein
MTSAKAPNNETIHAFDACVLLCVALHPPPLAPPDAELGGGPGMRALFSRMAVAIVAALSTMSSPSPVVS